MGEKYEVEAYVLDAVLNGQRHYRWEQQYFGPSLWRAARAWWTVSRTSGCVRLIVRR